MSYQRQVVAEVERLRATYPNLEHIQLSSLLKDSGYDNDREEMAAADYIGALISSIPEALDESLANLRTHSPASKNRSDSVRYRLLASYSTAITALVSARTLRLRTERTNLIESLQDEGLSADVLEMLRNAAPGGKISVLDWLQFEVDRRYKSTDWRERIAGEQMSEAVLSKEVAILFSVRAKLMKKLFDIREKRSFLRGAKSTNNATKDHNELLKRYGNGA